MGRVRAAAILSLGGLAVASACSSASTSSVTSDAPEAGPPFAESLAREATEHRVVAPSSEPSTDSHAELRTRTGLLPGMIPFHGPGERVDLNIESSQCAGADPLYWGGPILQSPTVIEVYWNSSVNPTLEANIGQFYHDVFGSSYWAWLTEYDTVGLPDGDQAILPGSFGGAVTITPVLCTGSANCALTDAEIETELLRQINNSVLPEPTTDCTGQTNTVYMFDFPSNVSITGPGNIKSCVNGGFCGYHYTATLNGQAIPYGVLPDTFAGGCANGCGAGGLTSATAVHSHELIEATTDADVGLATTYAPPLGWYDSFCGEVADICNGQDTAISINGHTWTVQQIWSNVQQNCVVSGLPLPVCTTTHRPPGCRMCSCGDTGGACNGATPTCETNASNVDNGACEQCTVASPQCPAGDVCISSSNTATDDTCAACGAIGEPCCTGGACNVSGACSAGQCVGCGGAGQPCCASNACTAPNTCGGGGTPNQCGCTPTATQCPSGQTCGTVSNGCGGTISCGTCTAPQTCGGGGTANQCGCTAATQCPAGQTCGTASNGCGGTISCGTCVAPQTCGGGGNTNQCGCTPAMHCPAGQTCGTGPDGCGGTLSCGTCTAPQTCGGGGNANQCGCTPTTQCPPGQTCGAAPNGCGGALSCGSCVAPQTCGGSGIPNQCGCTPSTQCPVGQNCGTASDGCGGTLSCGTCTAPQTCGGGGAPNQCGCSPVPECAPGQTCGTAADGCGGTASCGTCVAPQTCGGAGTTNQCGCTPTTCATQHATCGSVADTCGGLLSCGSCPSGQSCVQNACVLNPSDAGSVDAGSRDSGEVSDGASSGDASDGSSLVDARPSDDAAPAMDAARLDGEAPADGATPSGPATSPSGCGCRVAEPRGPSSALGIFGLSLVGVFGVRRRRRSWTRAS